MWNIITLDNGSPSETDSSNWTAVMAPATAPIPDPRRNPISVVWPFMAPITVPTAAPPIINNNYQRNLMSVKENVWKINSCKKFETGLYWRQVKSQQRCIYQCPYLYFKDWAVSLWTYIYINKLHTYLKRHLHVRFHGGWFIGLQEQTIRQWWYGEREHT